MRACCVVALFISAASADIHACVQHPDASDSCSEAIPLGDATSLLQLGNLKTTSGEQVSKDLADDCAEGSCTLGQWSAWTDCSKTCGFGTRSRSREVTEVSKDSSECGCLEQTETCCVAECEMKPEGVFYKVCGKVKSVVNNKAVPGAIVNFQDLEQTSDENGEFCFEEVPEGEATFISKKEDWVEDEEKVTVSGVPTPEVILEMAPKIDANQWRIVLTWGAQQTTPATDLDSVTRIKHVGCTKIDFNTLNNQPPPCGGMDGKLELDHCYEGPLAASEGSNGCDASKESKPETTFIDAKDCTSSECLLTFEVNHYSRESGKGGQYDTVTLEQSKAVVKVYNGQHNHPVNIFHVETHGVIKGNDWKVFSLDTKAAEVKDCQNNKLICDAI
jgi:hypothetical protein